MSPVANMLAQIKNAQAVGAEDISVPFSKVKLEIAKVLKNAGFIEEVESKNIKLKKTEARYLFLKLKYLDGIGAISEIKLTSKPSRRVYASAKDLRPVRSGYGIAVISTSKGIMTGQAARKAGVGGEALFEVW